jgi:hypothetical protein
MQNKKDYLMPYDLRVGDTVRIEYCGAELSKIGAIGSTGVISRIDATKKEMFEVTLGTKVMWFLRSELCLIYSNKSTEWNPKAGDIIWSKDFNSKLIATSEIENGKFIWCQFLEEGILDRSFPVPILGLEPYNMQDKAEIDFSKSGLILTNGYTIWITEGEETNDSFFARNIPGSGDANIHKIIKFPSKAEWRDITAEATPILAELKKLMLS